MEFLLVVLLPLALVAAAFYGIRRYRRKARDLLADVHIPPAAMSGLSDTFGNH